MSGVALGGRFGIPGTPTAARLREEPDAGRSSPSGVMPAERDGIAASGEAEG